MPLKPGARSHLAKVTGSLMYYVAGRATPEQTNEAYRRNIGELPPVEETYAMRLGSYLEPFMIGEWEKASGFTVMNRQEEILHPELPDDVFATVDGLVWSDGDLVITEFKFCGAHMSPADIRARYYDQVALQMMCAGADSGLIIAGQGTNELIEIDCRRDPAYEAELMTRIRAWLLCVKTLTPPYPDPMPAPPPEKWRTIDLDRLHPPPNWAAELRAQLAIYGSTKDYVLIHDAAGKAARELVPPDVGLVTCGDWRIARNKRGVLAIRDAAY